MATKTFAEYLNSYDASVPEELKMFLRTADDYLELPGGQYATWICNKRDGVWSAYQRIDMAPPPTTWEDKCKLLGINLEKQRIEPWAWNALIAAAEEAYTSDEFLKYISELER